MRTERELNEREQLILQAVVHTYITTAEPVGSRSIVKRFGLDLSPASVRNVMADLEELGFIEQLHTSSGRVPTNKGYRYYVTYLMRVQELSASERVRIETELSHRLNDTDEVMRQTSQLLALVSHHAGLVEAPRENGALVRNIELMRLSTERIAVLVADSYGRVKTLVTTLSEPIEEARLPELRRLLNEQLCNVPVDSIRAEAQQRFSGRIDQQKHIMRTALEVLEPFPLQRTGQLFLNGATQLFEQPEFQDVGKAREVFHLLDEQQRLIQLLREGLSGDTPRQLVVIGADSPDSGLGEISVVASPYYVNEKPVGMLGVLGPRRMPYSRLSALVEYTASMLSRFLTALAR